MVLVDVIASVLRASTKPKFGTAGNEANTKALLIEPVLQALGWNLYDIDATGRLHEPQAPVRGRSDPGAPAGRAEGPASSAAGRSSTVGSTGTASGSSPTRGCAPRCPPSLRLRTGSPCRPEGSPRSSRCVRVGSAAQPRPHSRRTAASTDHHRRPDRLSCSWPLHGPDSDSTAEGQVHARPSPGG